MQNLEHASILDQVIRDRRSIRSFIARPVPPALLEEALAIAQRAPSNSNVQPWRLIVASGARRDSLSRALRIAAERDPFPNIPPLPEEYQHYRSELGEIVYSALGIARDDQNGRRKALLRNYDFFDAPVVGILCMPESLGVADAVSVGIYLQTLMLSLTARGLGCCAQVALAGYPEVLRSELEIPSELLIICGLAIGYADPEFPANHLYTPREALSETITLL
jgi:nitroreductase